MCCRVPEDQPSLGTLARVIEKGGDSVLGWREGQASQTFELFEELRALKQRKEFEVLFSCSFSS